MHSLVPRLRVAPARLGSDTPPARVTALTQMAPGGLCPDQATERPRDPHPCPLCAHFTGWETGDKDQGEPHGPRGERSLQSTNPLRLAEASQRQLPAKARACTGHWVQPHLARVRPAASALPCVLLTQAMRREPGSHTPWRLAAAPRPAQASPGITSAMGLPRVRHARGHFGRAKSQVQSSDAPVPGEVDLRGPVEITRL